MLGVIGGAQFSEGFLGDGLTDGELADVHVPAHGGLVRQELQQAPGFFGMLASVGDADRIDSHLAAGVAARAFGKHLNIPIEPGCCVEDGPVAGMTAKFHCVLPDRK